jgi:hypothetical protein
MVLQRYQYQLDDVVFGRDTDIPVQKAEINPYNVNQKDFQLPRSDIVRFGVDTVTGGPIVFTMSVMSNYMLDNIPGEYVPVPLIEDLSLGNNELLHRLAAVWKDRPLRMTWGASKPLLYCDGTGQVRRIYGRPGKFTHTPRNKSGELWIDVQAEFRRMDTFSHSDIEYYAASNPEGDGILPGGAPISVSRLDGDGDAWLRLSFIGPMSHPIVQLGDAVVELTSAIAPGEILEFCSYPWQARVVDSNGVNRRTEVIGDTKYLDQIYFPAGSTIDVSWTCTGADTTTQMYFLWREAYNVI